MRAQRRFTRADLEEMRPDRERAQLLEPMSELVRRVRRESKEAQNLAQQLNQGPRHDHPQQ